MKFQFRAERVLDVRRRALDAARAQLLRATASRDAAERELAAAIASFDRAEAAFRDALAGGTDVGAVERHRNWITFQRSAVDDRRRAREVCRGVVDSATKAVNAAHRDVRVLERLRERAWRRHLVEMNRREMRELDSLATLQFARQTADANP
jgi:flagellar export protein FliJ